MRQRGEVVGAWALVALLHALPACWVDRVGLPPPRPPTGDTLCRLPPWFWVVRWSWLDSPFPSLPPRPSPWQRARCWSLCKYVPSSRASSGPYAHRLPSPIPPHIPIRLRPVGAAWVARSRSPCNGNGSGLALRCVLSFRLRSKRSRVAALGLRPRRPLSACLPSSACVVLVPPCRRFAAWLSPLCCAVACRRGACLCLHVSLRCPVCRST